VTGCTQPCKPCKVTYVLDYLPQGGESSPRGRWGICVPPLPEVLTVYIKIQKGMYELPHEGIPARKLLQRNLAKDGYRPTQQTHGTWTHDTRPISFLLVVDDFGVKYVGREYAEHLMACIKKKFNISSDWNVGAYCGFFIGLGLQKRHSGLIYARTLMAPSIKTNTLPQRVQNTHHTRGINPYMAPKRNL
jgi:hypothetical protein